MKKSWKIALIAVSVPLLSSPAWAERDSISEFLNTQQENATTAQQTDSHVTETVLSAEEDELDAFIASKLNDYTALLNTDPLGGLLEEEGVFDTGDVRQSVVTAAFNYLNIPYKYGGNNYVSGFDCSGLVMTIYRQVANKTLPRTTASQAAATTTIKRSELEPGDLVFFNTVGRRFSHVGIYVGDNKFIHAPRTGTQVRIDSINSGYWDKRFTGARRVVNQK
jgi:Cell wall-associated hydrolases (invasion-associated proteins)